MNVRSAGHEDRLVTRRLTTTDAPVSRGRVAWRAQGLGGLAAAVLACSGSQEGPPPRVYEDPGARVRAIARAWEERAIDEGFFEGDPNGVAAYRIVSIVRLELPDQGKAREVVTREE